MSKNSDPWAEEHKGTHFQNSDDKWVDEIRVKELKFL